MEQELASYIARQRLKGISETEIRSALIGSQWPIELIDRLLSTKPTIEPPPAYHERAETIDTEPVVPVQTSPTSHISTSQALLVIGVALIVIAAIAIITNSWPQLSPMLRFLVIATPNAALFLVSYFVKDKDRLEHVIDGTRAAAMMMLPATIGTFLYQFGLYQTIDSLLFFYSTTLALPFYLYGDIYRRQNYLADLTLINMLAAVLFIGQYLQWSQLSWEFAGLITGSIALGIAIAAAQHNDITHRRSYEVVSGILLFFVIPLLLGEIFNLWGSNSVTQSNDINLWVIWAIISGFIQLVVASFYGWLFKPTTEIEYSLQRFLQFGAMFCLFVPLIWASGEEVGFLIPTVVISGLVILLAMITSVNLLFISGVIGFVISLLFFLLKQVALEQLITLLILGFSAIGLSIAVAKLKFARQVIFSATRAESFGIISDQAAQELRHQVDRRGQPMPTRRMSWWLILLIILVGLWAVPALLSAVFWSRSSMNDSPTYYPEQRIIPTPKPTLPNGKVLYTNIKTPRFTVEYDPTWEAASNTQGVIFSNRQLRNDFYIYTEPDAGLPDDAFYSHWKEKYGFTTGAIITDISIGSLSGKKIEGIKTNSYRGITATVVVFRQNYFAVVASSPDTNNRGDEYYFLEMIQSFKFL